jgi:hypothetical protein
VGHTQHAADQLVKRSLLIAGALSAVILAGITVWTFAQLLGLWVWLPITYGCLSLGGGSHGESATRGFVL